ncbi:hypothetical protein SAY86_006269 [Trapa natans]|uniref:BHLH domain-containing protein n=1 Tax=Trapa natans TaxID=22666 RepID=A0AAN7QVU3_TRANT|nr:hypothetical protein SAY86_006269 [Trapa natans]
MPLFELFDEVEGKPSAAQGKPTTVSADQSFPIENGLVELIWQNGQVMMQGQSSRHKKNHSLNSSYSLPSHSPKRDRDLSSAPHSSPSLKLTVESGFNELLMSPSLGEMGLNSDDDIVPWLDYQMDEALETEFSSSFLPGLLTGSEPSQKDFDTMKKGAYANDVCGNSNANSTYSSLDYESSSKSSSIAAVGELTRSGTSHNPVGQAQFPSIRSKKVCENIGITTSNHFVSKDLSQVMNSAAAISRQDLKKQDSGPSNNCSDLRNFSHFLRPVALCKSTIGNNSGIADSGPSNMERAGSEQKTPSSDVKTVKSNSSPVGELKPHCHIVDKQETGSVKPFKAKPNETLSFKEFESIRHERAAKCDEQNNEDGQQDKCIVPQDAVEPVVESSICSGNGVDSISDSHLKRKASSSNRDFEGPNYDVEEDSIGLRKPTSARGSSSKRSRASDVHNLSERRRRDRINEKMRALQELIPNSNKVDKASMLDEAIDYLKTLQLQVQIMSMGAGLCMPPMMIPGHMAPFSPMNAGIAAGLGFRMGMINQISGPTAYSMLQVQAMQGPHFPSPMMSGHQALHGMQASNFPVMGLPSQGIPMPLLPPLFPFPGGLPLRPPAGSNTNTGTCLVETTESSFASCQKEVAGNHGGTSCPINHIPSLTDEYASTSTTAKRDETDACKVANK